MDHVFLLTGELSYRMIDVMTISNATFLQIIGRELDIYSITVDERDIALTHMTRNVAKYDHTIVAEFLT